MLLFTPDQMFWDCRELEAFERFPAGLRKRLMYGSITESRRGSKNQEADTKSLVRQLAPRGRTEGPARPRLQTELKAYTPWRNAVREYLTLTVTPKPYNPRRCWRPAGIRSMRRNPSGKTLSLSEDPFRIVL